MRKLILLTALLMVSMFLMAQKTISPDDFIEKKEKTYNNDEIQTVMSSFELKRISGFGGPTISYTQIDGEFAVMSGGGGGVIINNFFIGGYGEGTSNSVNNNPSLEFRNVEFGYGGFWLGYEFMPQRLIHPVVSTRLGWGSVSGTNQDNRRLSDGVFVVIPTVSAEINFTRFFKLNLGVEYRQTFNLNSIPNMSNKDFSSIGVYTSFLFGWF